MTLTDEEKRALIEALENGEAIRGEVARWVDAPASPHP